MNEIYRIQRRVIAQITGEVFETTLKELRSCSRQRRLTYARFAVWYLLHELRPTLSDFDLGEVLDKDRTSARNGIERANEFLGFNREFSGRLQRARELISLWRPGEPLEARNTSSLCRLAKTSKTPSADEAELLEPSYHGSQAEYETWFRNSCKRSEQRFLAIAMREHPERARVPVSEAAE